MEEAVNINFKKILIVDKGITKQILWPPFKMKMVQINII